jgi:hypothetical protein
MCDAFKDGGGSAYSFTSWVLQCASPPDNERKQHHQQQHHLHASVDCAWHMVYDDSIQYATHFGRLLQSLGRSMSAAEGNRQRFGCLQGRDCAGCRSICFFYVLIFSLLVKRFCKEKLIASRAALSHLTLWSHLQQVTSCFEQRHYYKVRYRVRTTTDKTIRDRTQHKHQ